jgi:cytosine deaminase
MLVLRQRYRDLCDMDFVAFPQTGLLVSPGTAELMEEALKLGVETVGGLDPAGIDGDPITHLKTIFDMAVRHGCGVDIHLHDRGELGLWQVARIADFTAATGLKGKVMISHAYCLGMTSTGRIEKLGRRLADLGISIMTAVPIFPAVPDAWSPMGNGDMLERAFLLAFRFEWGRDEELELAFDCATTAGARALGLADHGIAVGRPADFIFVEAENIGDALCRRPPRTVVRGGEIIAEGGRLLRTRAERSG